MNLYEHDGAIYKGHHRSYPLYVWLARAQGWIVYAGDVPKPVEWGNLISEADAAPYMTLPAHK